MLLEEAVDRITTQYFMLLFTSFEFFYFNDKYILEGNYKECFRLGCFFFGRAGVKVKLAL